MPLILRTYCRAAARMSSSVTSSAYGGRRVLMLRHMQVSVVPVRVPVGPQATLGPTVLSSNLRDAVYLSEFPAAPTKRAERGAPAPCAR